MNAIVSLDHRFCRTPDGTVWSRFFHYAFWSRYLNVFDWVRVAARVRDVTEVPAFWRPSSGAQVAFVPLVHYHGPTEYISKLPQVRQGYRNAIGPEDAVIMRVPAQASSGLESVLRQSGRPYGVEVIGDPYDSLSKEAFQHPLQPFLQWWVPRQMRRQCTRACAVSYVTEKALQRRYPPAPNAFATHYSSIELNEQWLTSPPSRRFDKSAFKLINIGTMDQHYKAQDVLIDAFASCVRAGCDLQLVLVGEGQYQPQLKNLAQRLGIADRVCFVGQVAAGDGVREELDNADLFVLPSRQEGLPRAMIEAMARGLPCIGSSVGGTPELLTTENLVPAGNANALASTIQEVVRNPQRMAQMSKNNLEKAKEYSITVLEPRRTEFYKFVHAQTTDWLKLQKSREV